MPQPTQSGTDTAVILAAGPGSRLLPHTAYAPKCLTRIGGYPILQYQIAALRECGVANIVIVVGYLSHCVRQFVDSGVSLVENPDFASTNSSYSLWLAREHMRNGYVHLNSDLLFEPAMLRTLLDAPEPNAVIVDPCVRPDSDMMKAHMDGRRILRMGKQLADAGAEVVGPAKFGPAGVERLLRRLEALDRAGERNRWAYGLFGELAQELELTGVEAPGCYWAEVDTLDDAADADRRIPEAMQELAARGVSVAR
jgi:L-glutamine-phosphate cytidylyltransferase